MNPHLRGALGLQAALIASPFALAAAPVPAPQESGETPSGETESEESQATSPSLDLGTMVVTPTGTEETILDVPYAVEQVDQERIEFMRTVPQTLRDVPGVLVQETGTGQGSPFIRGFTGYRTLFMVDGIRLNNSTFRGGPNQYAGTVDALSLREVEVVKGPSSVLYGSDAIGGTVNLITKDPTITDRAIGGRVFTRFASAANYNIQRVELGGAAHGDTFWHLGVTRKDFGDMESGDGKLPDTGYDEWDGDMKVVHHLDARSRLTFAAQRVDIDDAPRTHRTVNAVPFAGSSVGSDLARDFDQTRTLTYLRYNSDGEAAEDWSTEATLSYHRQEENRHRDRTLGRMQDQGFDVQTLGLGLKGTRGTSLGRLTTGFEWYHDSVDSYLDNHADQTPADEIQGPLGDDARYDLGGLYADLAHDLSERTTLTAGVRLTYAAAEANEVRDPDTDALITVDDDWTAITGSLRFETRLVEDADQTVALFGGVSQGFRAPSLSDLTRFDSARTNEFVVPSPGLDPEDYITYELGVKRESDAMSLQVAAFFTDGDDMIQRTQTGNVNGSGENEVAKANVGGATVGGVEIGCSYAWTPEWTTFGTVTWMDGQQDVVENVGDPITTEALSRLMPLTTLVGARFEPEGMDWYGELRWIHAEDADRLSAGDAGDTSRIPPGGTPGYDVVDLLGRYDVNADVSLLFGVENIFDENYRVHGSGQNRPGRNFVIGASFAF